MSDQEYPTSEPVISTVSYGIGVSKKAAAQLSSSGNAAKQKRKDLEQAREAKKAAEEKKAQEDLKKN